MLLTQPDDRTAMRLTDTNPKQVRWNMILTGEKASAA